MGVRHGSLDNVTCVGNTDMFIYLTPSDINHYSRAYSINNGGQIVGFSNAAATGAETSGYLMVLSTPATNKV